MLSDMKNFQPSYLRDISPAVKITNVPAMIGDKNFNSRLTAARINSTVMSGKDAAAIRVSDATSRPGASSALNSFGSR